MKKVVIIGAGATGLAAAYYLQQEAQTAGWPGDYLVIEQEQRLGGKILTERPEGFLLEGGPDCFLSEKPAVLELTAELGIEDRLLCSNEENKGTEVFSRGRLHTLPEGLIMLVPTKIIPFVLSPLISWPGKVRMAFDFVLPRKKEDTDETLASFVSRRMGREALYKIAEPLIGGIHGGDPETMSLKASFPRFLQWEQQYGSLAKAMLVMRKKMAAFGNRERIGPPRTYFMTYINGMRELTDNLASRLDQEKIITGSKVTKIEFTRMDGQPTYLVHVEGRPPVPAAAVIAAIPSNSAQKLVQGLDSQAAAVLGEIPMASSATIQMAYRRQDLPRTANSFGFVIPNMEGRKINALTYSSVKWNYRVPNENFVLLRTFVGNAKRSALAQRNEQEILQMARDDLRDILGITAKPVVARVYRWLNARPQYTLGHLERINQLEERLAQYPGLYVAGGCYRGIGLSDCVKDGRQVAINAWNYLQQ